MMKNIVIHGALTLAFFSMVSLLASENITNDFTAT